MNKYYIIIASAILFLAILGLIFFIFIFPTYKTQNLGTKEASTSTAGVRKEIPEPNIKISRYILSAQATAINNNEISITLQRLFAGEKGNYLDTDNKIVKVSSSTEIVVGKIVNKRYLEVPGKFSDIKAGQKLTFYSSENIKIMPVFSPYKIIINQ